MVVRAPEKPSAVAALHHLLGRLSEPCLVTIDRRNAEEAGEETQKRDHEQHHHRTRMGADRKIDDRLKAARRSPLTPLIVGCGHHLPCPLGRASYVNAYRFGDASWARAGAS